MSIKNPSITFFIASIGKPQLNDTLRSIHGQFGFGLDQIKVFFDGRCDAGIETFQETFDLYNNTTPGSLEFIQLKENLGYWGHGIRNKFQTSFSTDYVWNIDDDDIVCPDILPSIRSDLKNNYGKIPIYKIRTLGKCIIWQYPSIELGQVGTPSGLIFNRPEIFGRWGLAYGGDSEFYIQMQENIGKENLIFKDLLVYKTRPHIYGY